MELTGGGLSLFLYKFEDQLIDLELWALRFSPSPFDHVRPLPHFGELG
jgi:hypothetical protein